MRPLPTALAVLVLTATLSASLTACGADDGEVASDPAPTGTTTSAPPSTPPSTPTAEPTATYPPFEPTDYTYLLSVQCFCLGTGSPIEVTVADGEVTGAVYTQDDTGRGGTKAGDPADKQFWLTINDIIDLADDSEAELVQVDWPDGQDYPSSVFLDGEKDVADDEIGYTIADVRVSS